MDDVQDDSKLYFDKVSENVNQRTTNAKKSFNVGNQNIYCENTLAAAGRKCKNNPFNHS